MKPTPSNPSINRQVKLFKPKQSIPRNKLARGDNKRDKLGVTKIVNDTTGVLRTVFEKHAIGRLNLSESKLVSHSGEVTFLEQEEIVGNMRASILVVKSKSVNVAKDYEYDLVRIEREKIEREAKNKREQQEKTLLEIERLRKADGEKAPEMKPDPLLEKEIVGEETVVKAQPGALLEKSDEIHPVNTPDELHPVNTPDEFVDIPLDVSEDTSQVDDIPELEPVNKVNKKKERITRATRERREKAITDLKKQLEKKSYPNLEVTGNKHLRSFIHDLQKKFRLESLKDYRYFDIKSDTTMMIIEQARVYRIVLPECIRDVYHVIVGDLQLKSALVQKIDPGYDSNDLYKSHTDFIERIRAKEKAKILELDPDVIEKDGELSEDDTLVTDLLKQFDVKEDSIGESDEKPDQE